MYGFQSYSKVAQKGDALSMAPLGTPKPKTPTSSNMPRRRRRWPRRQPPRALFATTCSPFQPLPAADVRRDEAPPAATHRPCSASGRASIPPSRDVLPDQGRVSQHPQLADLPDVPAGGGAAWRRPASAGNVIFVTQEESGLAQRRLPSRVKEGNDKGLGIYTNDGHARAATATARCLLMEASAAFGVRLVGRGGVAGYLFS